MAYDSESEVSMMEEEEDFEEFSEEEDDDDFMEEENASSGRKGSAGKVKAPAKAPKATAWGRRIAQGATKHYLLQFF